jgi:hypothetical protein
MKKMLVFVFSLLPPLLPLFFASGSVDAQIAKEKPLMTKVLPDISGEEGLSKQSFSLQARSFRRIDITQMSLPTCWREASLHNWKATSLRQFTPAKRFTNRLGMCTLQVATQVR